jgi:hypothetical protein
MSKRRIEMKRTVLVLVAGIFLVLGGVVFAQSHTITLQVVPFAVVALNPGNDFSLTLDGTGVTAGSPTISATDSQNWVQYTFVSTAANTGVVSVQMGPGTAFPAGGWLSLTVTAGAPVGGAGDPGAPVGAVALTPAMGAAVPLINSISGCYTGNVASTNGSQLTYALTITPALIGSAVAWGPSTAYTVTYTVTP